MKYVMSSLAVAVAVVFAGCGPGQGINIPGAPGGSSLSGASQNDLKEFGLAFHNYVDATGNAPGDWDSLIAQAGDSRGAVTNVRNMEYVVHWNVHFRDAIIGTSNFVLAYPKDGKENGGWVVYLDGSVRRMSGADLQAALDYQEKNNKKPDPL